MKLSEFYYNFWVRPGQYEYSQQRLGQIFFNYLHEVRPDLAKELCATEIDPFNQNYWDVEHKLFYWLNERWEDS